jgi:hypothetical protein
LTEILEAMTRPDSNGTPALPKRAGPKGLLPSTWLERTLKVAYTDCYGSGQETPLVGPARALRAGRGLRGEGGTS